MIEEVLRRERELQTTMKQFEQRTTSHIQGLNAEHQRVLRLAREVEREGDNLKNEVSTLTLRNAQMRQSMDENNLISQQRE
eukprot:1755820-Amphidinium_carterae.1